MRTRPWRADRSWDEPLDFGGELRDLGCSEAGLLDLERELAVLRSMGKNDALRQRMKLVAVKRGTTIADMLRALFAREFPESPGEDE